jgi:hypothetical protein
MPPKASALMRSAPRGNRAGHSTDIADVLQIRQASSGYYSRRSKKCGVYVTIGDPIVSMLRIDASILTWQATQR